MESVFNLILKMPKEMLIQFKFNPRFVQLSKFMLVTEDVANKIDLLSISIMESYVKYTILKVKAYDHFSESMRSFD